MTIASLPLAGLVDDFLDTLPLFLRSVSCWHGRTIPLLKEPRVKCKVDIQGTIGPDCPELSAQRRSRDWAQLDEKGSPKS